MTEPVPSRSRGRSVSRIDRGTFTVVVTTPEQDRDLWARCQSGLAASMRSFGIQDRLPGPVKSPDLFCAVVDRHSTLLGGVHFRGPLIDASQSHAVIVWNGSGGDPSVEATVEERIDSGVIELRGAFVTAAAGGDRTVALTLGQCVAPAMTALRARYLLDLAPAPMLTTWLSTGVSTADEVPPVHYPDNRFRSRVMWWDREAVDRS